MEKTLEPTIKITASDGSMTECEMLFAVYSDEFDMVYVIHTTSIENELSALRYVADEDEVMGSFYPIETDEEWNFVKTSIENHFDSDVLYKIMH